MIPKPPKKIMIIVSTAVVTTLVILIIAIFRKPQLEMKYVIKSPPAVTDPHFKKILGDILGPPVVEGNQVKALYNGDEIFPAMIKAIRSAQKTITFESYIYWSGEVGQHFVDALSERARSGVQVHVLIDWLGSQKIKDSYLEDLKAAGVEVELYHVLKWYNISRMNNRTHRKILVIDGKIGFTGGVGIADEWNGNGLLPNRWRDTHFEVHGPVVNEMQSAFMVNWLKVRPEVHQSSDYFPKIEPSGKMDAQMFNNSAREGASGVLIMYLSAIASARKSILLESAYFVPDDHTIEQLVLAQKRGVNVEIIVPGVKTDSKLVRMGSREAWGPLLEAGIKIYEYQPALFHCKVLIVDEFFMSIGSTNFDERSFELNDEANLNILNADLAASEIKKFEIDKSHSKLVTLEDWKKRPLREKIGEKFTTLIKDQF